MTEVTDNNNVLATRYTNNSSGNATQKTVIIPAKAGYKIAIKSVSLLQYQETAGTTGTITITAQSDGGTETTIATFIETKTTPQEKESSTTFTGEAGKSVTLRWTILNSVASSKTYGKKVTYEYEYVSSSDSTGVMIIIPCSTEAEASTIQEKIKGIVTNLGLYIKQ